jgi:hypothetical protein
VIFVVGTFRITNSLLVLTCISGYLYHGEINDLTDTCSFAKGF